MPEKDLADIWKEVVGKIEKDLGKVDVLLSQVKLVSISKDSISLSVPNSWAKDRIQQEHSKKLSRVLESVVGKKLDINFIVKDDLEAETNRDRDRDRDRGKDEASAESQKIQEEELPVPSLLNPKYTFERFVVGTGNRLAHAAALAVADTPAKAYNPLFIYGGVGLGKTHLLHAVGNYIKKRNPDMRILYVSSETFTNDMIESIRHRTALSFRKKYRTADILLLDDTQFLRGKDGSQEEFFHTFNALYEANKQVVLTSDSHPKEIPTLEDRLRSRFEWGLIADIRPPDLETRIAILRKKSEELNVGYLPDDVALFIADRIRTNIRELEGSLITVLAYAELDGSSLTTDLAKEALRHTNSEGVPASPTEIITVEMIQRAVAGYYDLKPADMRAKKRTKAVALPRHIAMYLCRQLTNLSLVDIGKDFGGRDHTTVLHACTRIEEAIQQDINMRNIVKQLMDNVKRGFPG